MEDRRHTHFCAVVNQGPYHSSFCNGNGQDDTKPPRPASATASKHPFSTAISNRDLQPNDHSNTSIEADDSDLMSLRFNSISASAVERMRGMDRDRGGRELEEHLRVIFELH